MFSQTKYLSRLCDHSHARASMQGIHIRTFWSKKKKNTGISPLASINDQHSVSMSNAHTMQKPK